MLRLRWNVAWFGALLCALFGFSSLFAGPEHYTKADREFVQDMLKHVAADVPKYYYDSKLHGVDWDAKVQEARRNIDSADSVDAAVSEIAALLDNLNDSHTTFFPPPRAIDHDYGFKLQMIGERCYVTHVRTDSDAEKKGLKVGDEILAVDERPLSRNTMWRLQYIYNVLRPQPGLRLTLADKRQLEVMARISTSKASKYFLPQGINQQARDLENVYRARRARYFEKGDELLVVKIPSFAFTADETDKIIGNMRKHKGVVLDLRGNPGGFTAEETGNIIINMIVDNRDIYNTFLDKGRGGKDRAWNLLGDPGGSMDTLDRLLGGMFQYDQKICDRVGRDSTKPVVAYGRHQDAFTGRFVVLIDSQSASASEVFARVIQLEHRGLIVGDRSAGMVMVSRFYPHEIALHNYVYYGASITDGDLSMADGKSLEHVGVVPDILLLPTAQDLANRKDPVLAKAAGMVGGKLGPEEAGAAFPYEEPDVE